MSLTCKAAVTDGNGKISIEDITVSDPATDEILVRIKAAGVCHTDYDSLRWNKRLVLGHEGAGIVAKTGANVTGIKPGDKVILNWAMPCGHCFQCRSGNLHICENNSPVTGKEHNIHNAGHAHAGGTKYKNKPIERSFNLGTCSEYALVKASAVIVNHSEAMSFEAASIIGCGVMTGYGSVVNAAKVKPGSSVAVLGAGGVGLSVIQAARISGASKIIAVDINDNRLKLAAFFGATDIIRADKNDKNLLHASEKVKQLTQDRGADYAFECTGNPLLGAAPLAMVRNAGTAIQVSGIEQEISIDMNLFEWDKIYMNPLYGKCNPTIDFPNLIDMYDNKQLLLEEMITQRYALQDIEKAFDDMLNGRNAKGVIVFDK